MKKALGADLVIPALALGFAESLPAAESTARASLARSFQDQADAYQRGWHEYLDSLHPSGGATASAGAP